MIIVKCLIGFQRDGLARFYETPLFPGTLKRFLGISADFKQVCVYDITLAWRMSAWDLQCR